MSQPRYLPCHVGMIHYNSYWRTYSLVLEVNGSHVTELDSFGEINHTTEHRVRRHCTALDAYDRFYTVAEFAALIKE